jgi:hypothetical protein
VSEAGLKQRMAVNAAAFFMVFLWVATLLPVLADGDTWWHLGAGRWIVDNRTIPSTDPFSFSMPGAAWHAHEWGAEIVMWLVYRAGGLAALVCLAAAAAALAAVLLCNFMQRHVAPVVALSIAIAASLCLMASAWARPHLLALPLLVWWAAVLFKDRSGRPPPLAFALLMTLWANLHASFLFGLLLIGPVSLEALLRGPDRSALFRGWTIFGMAAGLAALVTPYGLNGFLYPLQVSSMTQLYEIAEWRPLNIRNGLSFMLVLLGSLVLFFSVGLRLTLVRAGLYALLLYMAFSHFRHQFVFAYVSWFIVAGALGAAIRSSKLGRFAPFRQRPRDEDPADRWALAVLVFLCIAAILVRLAVPVAIDQRHALPTRLIAEMPASLRQAPVFNEYSFGGPLIFYGIRPFIDGRADMYGDDFVGAYLKAERGDANAWQRIAGRYRIAWTILPPRSDLVPVLDRAGWRRLMSDDRAVIHVRPGASTPTR